MEEKKITMAELKTMISESVQETVGNEIAELKDGLGKVQASRSAIGVDERAEKSAEFIRDLALALDGKKTITTDTGSFGYTVPTELADAVREKKDKIAKIRKNAFVFQMDGDFQLPKEGTGVTAYWITSEADTDVTESNPTIVKSDLKDNYLVAKVRVPYKLLRTSGINVENFVSKLAARALVSQEETAFVGGDGNGQPSGIRAASITAIAQEGSSLAYDDIVNVYLGVPEQYRENGSFLVSTAALKLIMKLKDSDGLPIFNLQAKTIFGRPYLEVTDIPENLGTSANETEVIFGDLQEYWIKDGQTVMSEARPVSGRLQMDLFLYEAVDGVLVNADAFRKLTGVK